jgi:hypothetical protein
MSGKEKVIRWSAGNWKTYEYSRTLLLSGNSKNVSIGHVSS